MITSSKITALGAAAAFAMLAMIGCAADSESENTGAANEAVEVTAASPAEQFAEQTVEQIKPAAVVEKAPVQFITKVDGMIIDDSILYAVFEGGVACYDFADQSTEVVGVEDNLKAVAVHDGVVYVGGEAFYRFDGSSLERLDDPALDPITYLYSYGDRLMVGTADGLYAWQDGVFDLLFDDVTVSGMAADENGLWVGTLGQGLYRWDGDEFHKRYLLRDPNMFDTVKALDYNHRHLYVGTTNGLHVYDGGRWEVLTTVEGLPSNNVCAIDATAWVVYVGTEEGVVSFFDGDLRPVSKLAETQVNVLRVRGRQIIAATDFEGILRHSNNTLKVLVPSVVDTTVNILSLIP